MPCLNPVIMYDRSFPCGKCEECLKSYALTWAQRCMDELADCNGVGCFVTLTYDNDHLPEDKQLRLSDLQKFFKRLRKEIAPAKVRYFACGEYGGKNNRPHYHACLFNWTPSDLQPFSSVSYGSAKLAKVWQNGFVQVMSLDFERAKYCAKYLQKLDPRYHDVKPFTVCSRRPGIGLAGVSAKILLTPVRFINGRSYNYPRAYYRKLADSGVCVDFIQGTRSDLAANVFKVDTAPLLEHSIAKLGSGPILPLLHNNGT